MRQSWVDQDKLFNSVMLWAASLTTPSVDLGKLLLPDIHLSFSNIAVDNAESPKVISLNIKRSKTDQGVLGGMPNYPYKLD